MADVLLNPGHCPHESNEIVMLGDNQMRCGDCHTVLILVPRDEYAALLVRLNDHQVTDEMRRRLQ